MRTWDVPAIDEENECSAAWSVKLGSYVLLTHTPEGEDICEPKRIKRFPDDPDPEAEDPWLTVPDLILATMPFIRWDEVPEVVRELRDAPTLAYLDDVPTGRRDQEVAGILRLALAS